QFRLVDSFSVGAINGAGSVEGRQPAIVRPNETVANRVFIEISSRDCASRINGSWSNNIAPSYLGHDSTRHIEACNRAVPSSNKTVKQEVFVNIGPRDDASRVDGLAIRAVDAI